LANTRFNRGNLLLTTRRFNEAEKEYNEALSLQKQLAADFPSRPEFRQALAASHSNRGLVLCDARRFQEAEPDYDEALAIYKQLAAEFPGRPAFRREVANTRNGRGNLLLATRRLKAAEKDYNKALSVQKQLPSAFPKQPDLENELAGTCVNLARLRGLQGNWGSAKRHLLEGRPHHLAALKANPRDPTYRQFYRNHLMVLTAAHSWLLEKEDTVRTAPTRRDLGWNAPGDAYDAACFLSQRVAMVAQHDKLDDKQRREAAQFYGDAAMKLLRDAVSKGYKDVVHMKQDIALDPLRQREDFQKLVAGLERNGK
jgi:tetratricopeptide (TPR) repeat protein